jgi:hypothetical protein
VFHGVDGAPLTAHEAASVAGGAAAPGSTARAVTGAEALQLLGAHTVDIMQRDVALLPARGVALGWAPDVPSFQAGGAAAHAEWAALAG